MRKAFEPLFARVILRRAKKENHGSIIIPAQFAKNHADQIGEVMAVGPTADPSIKVGDVVYFGKHAGSWMKPTEDSEEFYILQDEDILCTVKEVNHG